VRGRKARAVNHRAEIENLGTAKFRVVAKRGGGEGPGRAGKVGYRERKTQSDRGVPEDQDCAIGECWEAKWCRRATGKTMPR